MGKISFMILKLESARTPISFDKAKKKWEKCYHQKTAITINGVDSQCVSPINLKIAGKLQEKWLFIKSFTDLCLSL